MYINVQYVSSKNTTSNKTNAKKYIVIHETDNFRKGADANAHARAQYNGNLSTSVHFYCGSDGIYQTAELDKCVWAIGKTYKLIRPIMDATNYNSINIEICVNEDGDYDVARQNAIDLTKHLMSVLGLGADRVIRHYDAKGKYCPRKMMDNPSLWTSFKDALADKSTTSTTPTKSLDDWANEVKAGKHGNGHANRESSLKKAGCSYSYAEVRARVNELCGVKSSKPSVPTKSLDDWAREVIAGKHGNGHANRKASLKKAGCPYSYEKVRARVNAMC